MSFQLSAQAITAQTAITRMSVRRCSTLPRQRGSTTAPKCPTSRSMAMLGSPASGREDYPWLGNSPASRISCVSPAVAARRDERQRPAPQERSVGLDPGSPRAGSSKKGDDQSGDRTDDDGNGGDHV